MINLSHLSSISLNLLLLIFSILILSPGSLSGAEARTTSKSVLNSLTSSTIYTSNQKNNNIANRILTRYLQRKINRVFKNAHSDLKLLSNECSKIVLKTGDIIEAVVLQIGPNEVKYQRCNRPNDPDFIVLTRDVLSIYSSDGQIIFRNTQQSSSYDGEARVDGLAIASLATGVLGLLIGLVLSTGVGLFLSIISIVLGAVSLNRIKRYPERFTGRGMARGGLISGIILSGLLLLLIIINLLI